MTKNEQPLVSVIMPAYNGERYIAQAIESVLNQTYNNWELDIVDDASTDGTQSVINAYHDKRIKLRVNKKNMGISYSSNKAIEMSSSKYIALLDDDDMATKDRLEVQVAYLEEHLDIDVLGGRSILIDSESNIIGYDDTPLYNPKLIKAYMHFANMRFTNGTTMIKREILDRNGLKFEEDCCGMQDWKLMIDCSKVGNISSIDRLLHYKRIHNDEFTTIMMKTNIEKRRECSARFQKESIQASGFLLSEEQLNIISRFVTEYPPCPSDVELKQLWWAFSEMIHQAYEKELDYAKELEYACKKILCNKVMIREDYAFIDRLMEL